VPRLEQKYILQINFSNGANAFDFIYIEEKMGVVDNLETDDPNLALSARMGKYLKSKIDAISAQMETFYYSDKTLPSATTKQKYLFDVVSANTTDGLPAGIKYWWIDTKFLSNKESSKYQMATQYVSSGQSRVFTRSYYSPNWTPWVEFVGAKGDQGIQGAKGDQGIQGATGANGLSGGRIIKNGYSSTAGNQTIYFPASFSNVCEGVWITPASITELSFAPSTYNISRSSFSIRQNVYNGNQPPTPFNWMAIGY
jgi:hypothetical protein